MPDVSHLITYSFLFVALYFEVFMLVTYLENRNDIAKEKKDVLLTPKHFPTVSIIVPCWNEATTLGRTVESLLNLDYPAGKLDIVLVDDGSTDGTWAEMQKWQSDRVRIFHKENGGKHTALNFGLAQSKSDLVGCLDADSYVDREALKHIVLYFENHPEVSAVTPSVKIWKPQNLIQTVQAVEYMWAVFLRKMFAYVNSIYITPGPFSIFKREVFETLGGYKSAHMTEDMEICMRMQSGGLKIGHAHTAVIHTSGPNTVGKLYKQRLRWTYGFIKNSADYRYMFLNNQYGNLGLFVFPIAVTSIFAGLWSAGISLWSFLQSGIAQATKIETIGFHLPHFHTTFDWFYLNTEIITVASLAALLGMFTILLLSRKITDGKAKISFDLVYFMIVYAILAPIWLFKALYNAAFSVATNWR